MDKYLNIKLTVMGITPRQQKLPNGELLQTII